MPQIQLSDRLFGEAQRRAREAGFATVDEFISDQLESDFSPDQENFYDRFTPEGVAQLMQAGKKVSMEEVDRRLANVEEAWRKDHAN